MHASFLPRSSSCFAAVAIQTTSDVKTNTGKLMLSVTVVIYRCFLASSKSVRNWCRIALLLLSIVEVCGRRHRLCSVLIDALSNTLQLVPADGMLELRGLQQIQESLVCDNDRYGVRILAMEVDEELPLVCD
jgi:hypothetical protein